MLRNPIAIDFRPAASGVWATSASMSAPCTILARRPRAGSSRPYLSKMDSNEHRPSTWPSSAPSTSNGTASFSRATRATSCGSTYRNSASLSRNRRISHGHAIRSTAAFFRVTNRIYRSPSIAAGTPRAVDRPPPGRPQPAGASRSGHARHPARHRAPAAGATARSGSGLPPSTRSRRLGPTTSRPPAGRAVRRKTFRPPPGRPSRARSRRPRSRGRVHCSRVGLLIQRVGYGLVGAHRLASLKRPPLLLVFGGGHRSATDRVGQSRDLGPTLGLHRGRRAGEPERAQPVLAQPRDLRGIIEKDRDTRYVTGLGEQAQGLGHEGLRGGGVTEIDDDQGSRVQRPSEPEALAELPKQLDRLVERGHRLVVFLQKMMNVAGGPKAAGNSGWVVQLAKQSQCLVEQGKRLCHVGPSDDVG